MKVVNNGLTIEFDGTMGHFPKEFVVSALKKQILKFVKCPKGFQGVRDTRYYCPSCNSLTRQREHFCHKCGQAVKYPKEIYVKSENKIILDWSEEE